MKKILYCTSVMVLVVILLPAIIVRSCGPAPVEKPPVVEIPEKVYEITVFNRDTERTEVMDLEEYIKGVVAAEMPADFDLEALKAQAVAARTFAYGRMSGAYRSKQGVHDGTDICTDSTHCQAWISRESAKKKWGIFFASRNWSRIERAVNETKGLIIVYQGDVINALFHASSPGRTKMRGSGAAKAFRTRSGNDDTHQGYITTVTISEDDLPKNCWKHILTKNV